MMMMMKLVTSNLPQVIKLCYKTSYNDNDNVRILPVKGCCCFFTRPPHIHSLTILLGTPVQQILLISNIFWKTWGFFQTPYHWISFFLVLSLSAKLVLKKRTSVALAGEAVNHLLEITLPANSTGDRIKCFHNSHQVWEQSIFYKANPISQMIARITMDNSSCSGEYYFEYMNEKQYWVVLVRGE